LSFIRPLFFAATLVLIPGLFCADARASIAARLAEDSAVVQVGEHPLETDLIRGFYSERGFKAAWSGEARPRADRLLAQIQAVAAGEGLRPQAYVVPEINNVDDRDLLISETLARFARDLSIGRINPTRQVGGMGAEIRPKLDTTAILRELAAGRELAATLIPVQPAYAGYHRLKVALARYEKLTADGGWPAIPDGPSIKAGMEDARLALVRKRLIVTGELAAGQSQGNTLDAPLIEAVKRFQGRHGIDPDGAIGKQTLTALNISAEERVRQVAANLERWRWMPRRLDATHIAVNLPAAHFELVREGRIDMAMRVVVGDIQHQTPTMATTMTSVVINPTWTVPPSIATKEILPKLRKDPGYLASNNMRILDAFDGDFEKSQGLGIDWSKYSKFPYRLRQKPGSDNALGQVKFNLDNGDDIYLHDTPKRQYFGRIFRALSHGCVRLERPTDLAKLLLPAQADKLDEWVLDDTTRTVKLDKPLTVYLMYMTSWSDEDGTVHFREDLYGHDSRLKTALKRRQQPAQPQVSQEPAKK
jgi:L,D-transpeptidase YcbB